METLPPHPVGGSGGGGAGTAGPQCRFRAHCSLGTRSSRGRRGTALTGVSPRNPPGPADNRGFLLDARRAAGHPHALTSFLVHIRLPGGDVTKLMHLRYDGSASTWASPSTSRAPTSTRTPSCPQRLRQHLRRRPRLRLRPLPHRPQHLTPHHTQHRLHSQPPKDLRSRPLKWPRTWELAAHEL